MIYKEYVRMTQCVVHRVGNKLLMDGIDASVSPLNLDEVLSGMLMNFFILPFKSTEAYCLSHLSDLKLNTAYSCVKSIFEDKESLLDNSVKLAQHLYDQSTHPNINGGEFYVAYFENFIIDGITTDAVGLFKSETKESYLKVFPKNGSFELVYDEGISINRLDKGALIFNVDADGGYLVAIVDNICRGKTAKYWIEDFLGAKLRKNEYSQTENLLTICKKFIVDEQERTSKLNRAMQLSKTIAALQHSHVNIKELASEVFNDEAQASLFVGYAQNYCERHEIKIDEEFDTSEEALKKNRFGNVSKIKLDEHFTIDIRGGEKYIEHGFDNERNMAFYKLYYVKEK